MAILLNNSHPFVHQDEWQTNHEEGFSAQPEQPCTAYRPSVELHQGGLENRTLFLSLRYGGCDYATGEASF